MGNKKDPSRGEEEKEEKGKRNAVDRESYARGNGVVPRPLFSPPENEPWS